MTDDLRRFSRHPWRLRGLGARAPASRTLRVFLLSAIAAGARMVAGSGAQAAGFDLDFFKPTTAATGYFHEDSGLTLGAGRLDTELASSYAYRPLVLRNQNDGTTGGDVVRDRVTTYLSVAYGLTPDIDVGVRFSAVARQIGLVRVDLTDGGVPERVKMAAPGDTDLILRASLVSENRRNGGFRLTLTLPVGVPTGSVQALASSGKISIRPQVTAGWHRETVSVAASVGFAWRPASEVPSTYLVVGSAALAGIGISWTAVPQRLWLLLETSVSVGTNLTPTAISAAATQIIGGPRFMLPGGGFIQGGMGTGLNGNAGSPRFAAMGTLGHVW